MLMKLSSVNKIYSMGKVEVRALNGINLELMQGEFLSVVGTSGSGKSTLMNIMGCLDTPTQGSYVLDGEDVSGLCDRRLSEIRNSKIGFVFQGFNLIPSLTAYENIELVLNYRKVSKSKRRELIYSALESVKLSHRALHRPAEMSGGQQQRVAIARAIVGSPSIILADEPCGNLDSRSGHDVMEILRELNRKGNTVVLITHDESAATVGSRIIRMSDGKIVCA